MQTKADLEEFYKTQDPWGYANTTDDFIRRNHIASVAKVYAADSVNTLDIGCGEGYVTKVLPGKLFGIEVSDNAVKRWPKGITRLHHPQGKFGLIVAAGVLYEHYDYQKMRQWIEESAQNIVVTCHYDQMKAHDSFNKKQIYYAEFDYREGKQIMKVYQW